MKIFQAQGLTKSYGEKVLFGDLSFHIGEQERIGLVGVNGTGKSSLLKIIAGQDEADSGELSTTNDYTIGYLPQEPELNPAFTVLEQVYKSESPIMALYVPMKRRCLKSGRIREMQANRIDCSGCKKKWMPPVHGKPAPMHRRFFQNLASAIWAEKFRDCQADRKSGSPLPGY